MLTDQPKDEKKTLKVAPQQIEIILSEDGIAPVSLFLPPYKDMREMSTLTAQNFSTRERVPNLEGPVLECMARDRMRLERRMTEFGKSRTYWHRLANLAAFAGDFQGEADYLATVAKLQVNDFVSNRIGENLIARHLYQPAERHFAHLDLSTNLHANLRLAAFHALVGVSRYYVKT